ncbi:uncharacterized protein LOC124942621 [Impatiens glandulifera]|uniref:uncharacterized protein LOC124942621 n=1 Tax=Impatiens glandulifera TaxID=253017 RepID=UPI001FB13B78|nr:uncharacterized protein LOC124942621 [Impatiens glandulifera]
MRDLLGVQWLRFLLFFSSIALQFVSGLSKDSSDSSKGVNGEKKSKSTGNGSMIAVILLVTVAALALSFFLFKIWQKKKRDEQYARLLKLFEEDDELELELGLQD